MTNTATVNVNHHHLRVADSSKYGLDPVSLALLDSIPAVKDATVGLTKALLAFPGARRVTVPLPEVAVLALSDFDAGRPVEPFSFTLSY